MLPTLPVAFVRPLAIPLPGKGTYHIEFNRVKSYLKITMSLAHLALKLKIL